MVLTGFMGSGKTTVGRLVADRLAWRFADLDHAIEARVGLPVPEIFAQKGEPFFREAERSTAQQLLQGPGLVLALGGGALHEPGFRNMLAAFTHTVTVHLHAPFPLLYARCLDQAGLPGAVARPLLGEREAAAARYGQRLATYQTASHWEIDAAAPTPEAVADQIVQKLMRHNNLH